MSPPYPWQQAAWGQLTALWEANRPPHALLLQGMTGIGKADFAKAFVSWLLDSPEGTLHPDYRLIAPNEKGTIPIDVIREANAFLQKTSVHGGRKIILIENVDALQRGAANAFLKTLEEPPGDSLIILVATQSALLPATIRSRCQKILLGTPEPSQALSWLEEQGVAKASFWLRLAQGAPLRAKSWGRDEARRDFLKQAIKDLQALAEGKLTPCAVAKPWADCLPFALPMLIQWFCDIQYVQSGVPTRAAFAGHPSLGRVCHKPLPWQCLQDSLQLYQAYQRQAGQYGVLQLEAVLARWQSAYA